MNKVSGFGNISQLHSTFGIITSPGYPQKIYFTADSANGSLFAQFDSFVVGEKVGFTGEKMEPSREGCNYRANYVRKMSEIPEQTGKIQTVNEKFTVLTALDTGERVFCPGGNFKSGSNEKDLRKSLKEGDLVDFFAIPSRTKMGVELLAIQVSFQKFPALIVYQQSGYSVLWSKYHGKIFCPRNLLEVVSDQQSITLGSWVKCILKTQEPKGGTHWVAIEVSPYQFAAENFEISVTTANLQSVSVRGIGLICACEENVAYLWNDFIGRICLKKAELAVTPQRLKLADFEAKFQLNFQSFDQAWVASDLHVFSHDVMHLSTVKFGCGEVLDVKPAYGFIHVPGVGGIYFRRSDYDGFEFEDLKGKKCGVIFVESFDPKNKGAKGHRGLYVVEDRCIEIF